jgi:hypothetical protein
MTANRSIMPGYLSWLCCASRSLLQCGDGTVEQCGYCAFIDSNSDSSIIMLTIYDRNVRRGNNGGQMGILIHQGFTSWK